VSVSFTVNNICILILELYFQVLDKVTELDANRQEIIMECLEVRQGDIQNALLEEKCAISGPILQDFDWKIKVREIHFK
jgi:hypothetical protein